MNQYSAVIYLVKPSPNRFSSIRPRHLDREQTMTDAPSAIQLINRSPKKMFLPAGVTHARVYGLREPKIKHVFHLDHKTLCGKRFRNTLAADRVSS
jgi:hypothetical protein